MGLIKRPLPVKLIVPMLSAHAELFVAARDLVAERFGPPDLTSARMPFTHTQYYAEELGTGLERCFVCFERLIDPAELAEIKVYTNDVEARFSAEGRRRINLDPGYLSPGKLVLATTKDQAHRIYVGLGIYAEVTLAYRDKDFRPWQWTYPDYRGEAYLTVLREVRRMYMAQLRSQGWLRPEHNSE